MAKPKLTPQERFWLKVHKTATCWLWCGARNSKGYGVLHVNGRQVYAHRFSYEIHGATIPSGLVIDHLCRNPKCVRPDHLEPVKNAENVMRGEGWAPKRARATHCVNGHELAGENLYIRTNGRRACRTCSNRMTAAHHKRKRRERGLQGLPTGPKACPHCAKEFKEFRQWIGHMRIHR